MGILKKITEEYFGDDVRKGEGVRVVIEGRNYILKFDYYGFAKELVPLNEDGDLFVRVTMEHIYDGDVFICRADKDDGDEEKIRVYYTVETDKLEELTDPYIPEGYIKETVSVDDDDAYDPIEDGFLPIEILYEAVGHKDKGVIDFDDCFHVMTSEDGYYIENVREYDVYESEEKADERARAYATNYLEGEYRDSMDSEFVEKYMGSCGDDWIYTDSLEEAYKEDRESYFDDIKSESGDHGNRLYDELMDAEVIEDTAEYFNTDKENPLFEPEDYIDELVSAIVDETGEGEDEVAETVSQYDTDELIENLINYEIIPDDEEHFGLDYTEPKFNDDDKIYEAIETEMNDDDFDVVQHFLLAFGELYSNFYNLDKLADGFVRSDGRANYLSSWDGEEYTCDIDDTTYYVYIN